MKPPSERNTLSEEDVAAAMNADTEPPPGPLPTVPTREPPATVRELGERMLEWFADFEQAMAERMTAMEEKLAKSELVTKADELIAKLTKCTDAAIATLEKQHAIAEEQRATAIRIEAALLRLNDTQRNGHAPTNGG